MSELRARIKIGYAPYAASGDELAGFMHQYLALGALDRQDDLGYQFRTLTYLTLRAELDYPNRGRQALDDGISTGEEALAFEARLPAAVRSILSNERNTLIMQVAGMRLLRYQRIYEQLLTELPQHEAELIRSDVELAIEALTGLPHSWSAQPHTRQLLAQAYVLRASLDDNQVAIDEGINLARASAAEARTLDDPQLASFEMHFASSLVASERAEHIAEAIEILDRLQKVLPAGSWLARSLLMNLATARCRAWILDQDETRVPGVRQAFLDSVAADIEALPFVAVQTLTQWGGWARMLGSADETALTYAAALRLLPVLLAGETNREQKAQILRSLPDVAAAAAIGLAEAGLPDDAARAFEDGRAALFADALRAETGAVNSAGTRRQK